jgi:CDI immunity proteins
VKKGVDTGKSLNALLGWKKDSGPFPTPLVERVNEALELPLKDLKWPAIRLLISQNIGLEYLMPWAIGALEKRPLYCCEYYDGDLLTACLRVERDYWVDNLEAWQALSTILSRLDSAMDTIRKEREKFELEAFRT